MIRRGKTLITFNPDSGRDYPDHFFASHRSWFQCINVKLQTGVPAVQNPGSRSMTIPGGGCVKNGARFLTDAWRVALRWNGWKPLALPDIRNNPYSG